MADTLLTFQYRQFAPPGGKWFYRVPETGRFLESLTSLSDLLTIVTRHYQVNNLKVPPNLQALVEHYICINVTPGFCSGPDPRVPSQFPISVFEISEATEKMFRGKGVGPVGMADAIRRAGVCRACPSHSLGICTSCNQLQTMARRLVRGRPLTMDRHLGVCKEFRVPVNGLVQVSEVSLPKNPLPPTCWVVVEGEARKKAVKDGE